MSKILLALFIVFGCWCHGQVITTVAGGNGFGADSVQLEFPYGIWLDRSGNIYVSDQTGNSDNFTDNSRIQKFPAASTSVTGGVTVAGGNCPCISGMSAANQLYNPSGVFVDSAGNIYVADPGNYRIQLFAAGSTSTTNGVTVAGGNGPGSLSYQLNDPLGIFVDKGGNVYVADADNDRILEFMAGSNSTSGGITVAGGKGLGGTAYQLSYPSAVYVDNAGHIYVADYLNNRVQKFSPPDTNAVTVAGGNGMGDAAKQLNSPAGIFIDNGGNLYVADFYNNRVQKFPPGSDSSTAGVTVAGGNGLGSDMNQLSNPTSVYVDSSGSIYVVDYLNNRVQKYSEGPAGINTIAGDNIGLYPNPNNGSFILRSTESIDKEYTIYDMIGRAVGQGMITSDRQSLSISNLSSGTYLLEIKNHGSIRLMIENQIN